MAVEDERLRGHLLRNLAALEAHRVERPGAAHLHLHHGGEGVDDGHADAVQPRRHLIPAVAKLAPRVQHRQHGLQRGPAGLGVDVARDASAVVRDGDGAVREDAHLDRRRVAGERLVHRVVHHLKDQVVQAARPGGTNVHARSLAHRLQVEAWQHARAEREGVGKGVVNG